MTKIILRDFAGKGKEVEISDEIDHIEGVILSGDMVMEYPFYCDSCNDRMQDFYDGRFYISRENFEKMNELTYSYDIQQLEVSYNLPNISCKNI